MLKTKKCCIAGAFIAEIILFSVVTFAIAYITSINAITKSSGQLADSMMDTVNVRVSAYMRATETSVRDMADLATGRPESTVMPSDAPDPTTTSLAAAWFSERVLDLRTRMMIAGNSPYTFALQFEDQSLAAVTMFPGRTDLLIETVLDARYARSQGYRQVFLTIRNLTTHNEFPNPIALVPLFAGGRDNRTTHNVDYFRIVNKYGRNASWCVWVEPQLNADNGAFEYTVGCAMFNQSGTFLGLAATVQHISTLSDFLAQAATTINTQIFVVDNSFRLVAATTAMPTAVVYTAEGGSPSQIGANCELSANWANASLTNVTATELVGCLTAAESYPYAALQALFRSDPNFLVAAGRRSDYRSLDGHNYYLVSVRITDPLFVSYAMNLVLFLPEDDVIGDVQQGILLSIVICLTLCVLGALMSTFLIMTLVAPRRKRRRSSSTKARLPTMSRLETVYSAGILALRKHDRLRREVQRADERREAIRLNDDISSNHSDAATSSAAAIQLDLPVATELTVVLMGRLSGSTRPEAHDGFRSIAVSNRITLHGGEPITLPDSDEWAGLSAAVWRESSEPSDDRGERAILCGLSLSRAGLCSSAVVSAEELSRYAANSSLVGTAVFLSSRDTLCSRQGSDLSRGVVVTGDVPLRMPDAFVFQPIESDAEGLSQLCTAVTPNAWERRDVVRHIHFDVGFRSLHVLLRDAGDHASNP